MKTVSQKIQDLDERVEFLKLQHKASLKRSIEAEDKYIHQLAKVVDLADKMIERLSA